MIDRSLIESILLKLDEYSTQRALPTSSGGFRDLGDEQTVLEHLLYIKNKLDYGARDAYGRRWQNAQ
jgi:hypothetical protein